MYRVYYTSCFRLFDLSQPRNYLFLSHSDNLCSQLVSVSYMYVPTILALSAGILAHCYPQASAHFILFYFTYSLLLCSQQVGYEEPGPSKPPCSVYRHLVFPTFSLLSNQATFRHRIVHSSKLNSALYCITMYYHLGSLLLPSC